MLANPQGSFTTICNHRGKKRAKLSCCIFCLCAPPESFKQPCTSLNVHLWASACPMAFTKQCLILPLAVMAALQWKGLNLWTSSGTAQRDVVSLLFVMGTDLAFCVRLVTPFKITVIYKIVMHRKLAVFLQGCIVAWYWDAVSSHFVIIIRHHQDMWYLIFKPCDAK